MVHSKWRHKPASPESSISVKGFLHWVGSNHDRMDIFPSCLRSSRLIKGCDVPRPQKYQQRCLVNGLGKTVEARLELVPPSTMVPAACCVWTSVLF